MAAQLETLDILCRVVDNYGDIGVAYRLARSLSELPDSPSLRLIVDDLTSFAALAPGIDPGAAIQECRGWKVVGWEAGGEAAVREEYRLRPPRVVIESLACGRPDWLEEILFGPETREPSLIIDLEHLTAEPFAAEFHRMPSLTRSPLVRKALFFPGFVPGTGGLILDRAFLASREEEGRGGLKGSVASRLGLPEGAADRFWAFVFTYERDFSAIVRDLAAFGRERPLLVLVASGKSSSPLEAAWAEAGRPFPLFLLPFLPQEDFDRVLLSSDFSIVRGEDSFSRLCLAGKPFLWQAYPQEERQQLVKLRAFLGLIEPRFPPGLFRSLERASLALNERDADSPTLRGADEILPLLESAQELEEGFSSLSADLAGREGLAKDLLSFIAELEGRG